MHKPTLLFLSYFSLFLYHDASGMLKRKLSTSFDHLSLVAPPENDDTCEKTPIHEQDEDDIEYDHQATKVTESHGENTTLLRLLSTDEINSDIAHQINALIKKSPTRQSIDFGRALEIAVSKGHVLYIEKFLPYASKDMHSYIRYATYGAKPSISLPLLLPFTSNLNSIDKEGLDQAKLAEVNKALDDHRIYVADLPVALGKALCSTVSVKPLQQLMIEYVATPLQKEK